MNFTLSTILIIFFLIPGFIFRRAYYSSPFPRKYSKFSLFGEISWIIIPSIILQILGIYLVYWCWYENFLELRKLYNFIIECYKPVPNYEDNLNYNVLVIYTAALWVISFASGYLINLVIRRTHLDKRFKIFSFDNEWYYYLSGEILDFPNIEGTSKDVGLTFVDVLTKTGEETVLYSGVLQKFDLKEDGGLASICLTNAQRKGFANSKTSEIVDENPFREYYEYKEFPSTFLVIPFDNILNLNVRFFKVNIKPYVPPALEENRNNATEKEKKPKLNFDISTGEAILLGVTLLMLIVLIISFFSKPDKTAKEKEEDRVSSISALVIMLLIPIAHFGFKFGWLVSILCSIGVVVAILWLLYLISFLKEKRGKENLDKKD